ncbi:MAG: tripartite tricarboxylate transporter permease [Nitrospirae bacterium]|nr:tripartite tricarboxylate transporter permease [Nitrospirota bacterium]MCL5422993.1 tripartite tricarboxylate transporter permease [Nitrospirota bacterium]
MVDIIYNLGIGFVHCFSLTNLVLLMVGLILGLLVGVLPGLTLVMGVVLALPFTYAMDITPAVILLTAIYVSGTYGGAFTSILFRIPGEPIHVPLLWDGYAMARQGKPALALGWTLLAACIGGLVSSIAMVFLAQPIAQVALTFSSPDYFAIVILGLMTVVTLNRGSITNAYISLFLGLLLTTVGVDAIYGSARFTFDSQLMMDGIDFLTIMVGAYGIGEVLTRLGEGFTTEPIKQLGGKMKTQMPSFGEVWKLRNIFMRSTIIGHLIGLIAGAGATVSSFVAYGVEGQYSKRKKEMGSGIPEGIAAPQAAATASVGGAMVPLLTLGIPHSAATAVILAAFLLHGLQPGPQVFITSAPMVYTIFASLILGIIVMCVIGYFAVKPLVKVLDYPESVISSFIMVFCFIGAFSIRNNITDLWFMIIFGIVGYIFEKIKFPIAPLVLGAILGRLAENSFMTTMISYQNDWTIFFRRPVSAVCMVLSVAALFLPMVTHLLSRKKEQAAEVEQG